MKQETTDGLIRLLTEILLPIAIFLSALRLLMTPAYVSAAYRVPGFPQDPYGFTLDDRLRWSGLSLEYLLNEAGIEFLGDLKFDDGAPVFNPRELRHMRDVKALSNSVLTVWTASLVGLGLLTAAAYALGSWSHFWAGIRRGARWTVLAMVALTGLLLLSFPLVFVGFHRIFFEGNSWLFLYSDTLIRLFPERFWQQVFAALVLLTLALAGASYSLGRIFRTPDS